MGGLRDIDTAFLFLSYRRTQLYFAEALAYELAANGIRTWFDLQRLKPGANWKEAIQRGLENCAGAILVASKSALESPHVELEWRHALETGKPVYVVLFDLPGQWSAVTDFAGEPYKTMLQDHEGMAVIWGGTDNDALWMVALNYPSLEAVTALWTAVGDGARQSLEVGYPVEWFMRDHTTVTVLRGQTEWLAAVEAHENIIVFHVLGGGEWGFSETLPDGIVDFITSAG